MTLENEDGFRVQISSKRWKNLIKLTRSKMRRRGNSPNSFVGSP